MENIEAFHAQVPADDICCGISLGMADMQSGSGWIREHVEDVDTRPLVFVGSAKSPGPVPVLLPLRFNSAEVKLHAESSKIAHFPEGMSD